MVVKRRILVGPSVGSLQAKTEGFIMWNEQIAEEPNKFVFDLIE